MICKCRDTFKESFRPWRVSTIEVAVLIDNELKEPGVYNYQLSILPVGRQVVNYQLTSGIYFYQIHAGN